MKSNEIDPTVGRSTPLCRMKRSAILGLFTTMLVSTLLSAAIALAESDEPKEFPGLSKPTVLFVADGGDWERGCLGSLAFTVDNNSIVASLQRLPGSAALFLLGQRVGEVRVFSLPAGNNDSTILATSRDMAFEVLKTPMGTCPDPILLAGCAGRFQKAEVIRPSDNKSEQVVIQKLLIPRAGKATIHTSDAICFALTPKSKTIVVGTGCMEWEKDAKSPTYWGDIKGWDLESGEAQFAEAWDGDQILDLACSADGKLIAAGGGHATRTFTGRDRYRGRVVCWNGKLDKKLFDLALPNHQVHALAFSPDGKFLVTGGIHGDVKWIDVAQGTVVKSLDVASLSGKTLGRVETLAVSPDGKLLAVGVGSWNRGNSWGETFLIDAAELQVYKVPSSRENQVITCVAFSPDGKSLAAAGMQGVLKLWKFAGETKIKRD